MLKIEGFWLVEMDYCAVADETLDGSDGAVHGPADNRQGGVMPQKDTVVLVLGLGDDRHECPMVVPGTNHHVVVIFQLSSR